MRVFGRSSTHIAFSGTAVMAVLDEADPHPLARQLHLETAIDTPQKAMFGREVRNVDVVDRKTGAPRIESAVLTVSPAVATHPGKVLAGCSYGAGQARRGSGHTRRNGQMNTARAASGAC